MIFSNIFADSTWHLFEESPGGLKHYGKADENDLDEFEKYLEEGGKCSYVFTEFPSNPILVSTNLIRLRKLVSGTNQYLTIDTTAHMR
jgi:cystathionine gamma-synthase